jgi:hypothetical protein
MEKAGFDSMDLPFHLWQEVLLNRKTVIQAGLGKKRDLIFRAKRARGMP